MSLSKLQFTNILKQSDGIVLARIESIHHNRAEKFSIVTLTPLKTYKAINGADFAQSLEAKIKLTYKDEPPRPTGMPLMNEDTFTVGATFECYISKEVNNNYLIIWAGLTNGASEVPIYLK